MKKIIGGLLAVVVALGLVVGSTPIRAQQQGAFYPSDSRFASYFPAVNYGKWTARVLSGSFTAGTYSLTMSGPGFATTPSGTPFMPFSVGTPILVGTGSVQETVTPTGVSGCAFVAAPQAVCVVTGAFSFGHGPGTVITSASNGAQEAVNFANAAGGGEVVVDSAYYNTGGTRAMLSALVPYNSVSLVDISSSAPQYWTVTPQAATVITAPTTLTASTVGSCPLTGACSTAVVGTWTNGTVFAAIACVDAMGNESQPSATFSFTSTVTTAIGFTMPAAQTGCVGWVPYLSLVGGSYALAYRVPVATYSGGVASSNGVCTLTQIETVIAACAIPNTTYGQAGSAAVVTAVTVNTARIWVGIGGTSSTSDVVGNSSARQSYAYVPGAHVGIPGVVETSLAFSAATAPATTVPAIVGTVAVPPGYMNFPGRTIRICGTITEGGASTATVEQVSFYWDADGSNATGAGVLLPGPTITTTLTGTPKFQFCQNLTTTVAGTSATAGSIQTTQGYITSVNGAAGTVATTTPTVPGAGTASLNLAQEARIDIDYLHTTGTDGAPTLTNLSVEPVN